MTSGGCDANIAVPKPRRCHNELFMLAACCKWGRSRRADVAHRKMLLGLSLARARTGKMGLSNRLSCGRYLGAVAAIAMLGCLPAAALADCGNDGIGFASWLERFKAKAAAAGV